MRFGTLLAAALLSTAAFAADSSINQWRTDKKDAPFNFMGIAVGDAMDQAKGRFQFGACRLNDNPSMSAWAAITSPETALVIYDVDGKVGAMQYFFLDDQALDVRENLVETYGKATWRDPPGRGGRAIRLKWNTPSGVMQYHAHPDMIGRVEVNAEYLHRVIDPGYWLACEDVNDSASAIKVRNLHPSFMRRNSLFFN